MIGPGELRVGTVEVTVALALFALIAAVPRSHTVRDAGVFAPMRVTLDVAEHGNVRRYEGPCPLTVGRSSAAGLVVMDAEASRLHARFECQAGVVYVSDAGSSNGTFLNGHRLDGALEVRPGDTIDVGATRITFAGAAPWA